jgi:DNA-binding CsgD family transcriptional regulator
MQQGDSVSSALVDDIYAAALGEHGWNVPLQGVRELANVRLAGLLSFEHASQQPAIDNTVGDDDAWVIACRHAYNTEFYRHDPAPGLIGDWPAGRWYEDTVMLPAARRKGSVFYEEFIRPQGLGSTSGLFLHRGEHDSAFLTLVGPTGSQGLEEARRRQIDVLQTHISRALRMQMRLKQQELNAAIAESSLDALPLPVFVLHESRKLLHANARAQGLMSEEPALCFLHGRFAPSCCPGQEQWQAACMQGGLLLTRKNGSPLPLTLIPLPPHSSLARLGYGRLTLMIAAAPGTASGRAQRLRLFYRLTAAEADLAVLLCCEGLSPQECADLRHVSIGTIRSQLKSIHAKTGVVRSGQLVRLVLQV